MFLRAFLIFSAAISGIRPALAQEEANFFEDILITEEVKTDDKAAAAAQDAKRLLQQKPQSLKIDLSELPTLNERPNDTKAEKLSDPADLSAAPFGLLWGASVADIKNLGVTLQPTELKDYVNSYKASNLPKPLKAFREVILTFGADNELWRIIAYGNFLQDSPDAAQVTRLYKDYYQLLAQKYGNAQEFFTPAQKMVEKQVKQQGRMETVSVAEAQPIGNPAFLSQLQSGEATLYATFENPSVGASLAVNVDGDNQSYIIIDYKNLTILKQRQQQTLDAL